MSRIGKQPVPIPSGVTIDIVDDVISVRGPRGELKQTIHPHVSVTNHDEALHVAVANPDDKNDRALWGLFRNLIKNMVNGVTQGFKKQLELVGVGYKVSVSGQTVTLHLGYSHPLTVTLPPSITASVDKNTLTIEGNDKQIVGEVAASIRRLRKPEPYKGKGVKYSDEVIKRKAGKAVKAVGK